MKKIDELAAEIERSVQYLRQGIAKHNPGICAPESEKRDPSLLNMDCAIISSKLGLLRSMFSSMVLKD